jgi:hypothetical protein
MRRLFTLLPFIFLLPVIQAQTLQPNVISANGGVSKNDQMSLEWTVGEPFIDGVTGVERSYTEGFHQPVIEVGRVESSDTKPTPVVDEKNGITVYPNPVKTGLNIDLSPDVNKDIRLQLISAEGIPVMSEKMDPALHRTELDMSSLIPGQYVLWITNLQGEKIAAFSISKIQ